ncbi:MAG: zf-HC2 domain-containing protein [Clostridia bacterium]|nr:zf-HC2 domain-containing protein [Clostridia bacterium]
MSCGYDERLRPYLEEELSLEEMKSVRKHLETCPDCQQKLDQMLNNPLELPVQHLEADDEVIISKIQARKKGLRRIAIYSLGGFLLGLFSRLYTQDHFIVTKAIMALPYKLAEFALGIFFSDNVVRDGQNLFYHIPGAMGYFPYHPILDWVSSIFTPALIGAFIAMLVGYLVSDKRVFQRKKVINFLGAALVVILAWTGVLYGAYSYTLVKIDTLTGIKGITFYTVDKYSSSWLISLNEEALAQEKYAYLTEELSRAKPQDDSQYPRDEKGYVLLLEFQGGGSMPAHLDPANGALITLKGNKYQLSQSTVQRLNTTMEVLKNEQTGQR